MPLTIRSWAISSSAPEVKYGKFKPWLLAGILSTSVVIYLMFNVQLQGWKFVVFFGVMYFAFSITYTMNDIFIGAWFRRCPPMQMRETSLPREPTLFAGIGGTAATILIPLLRQARIPLAVTLLTHTVGLRWAIGILAPLFSLYHHFWY